MGIVKEELKWEKQWWGNCQNTFHEDIKHYWYARYMGLSQIWHYFEGMDDKKILDIGGGPTSMLLKCSNLKEGKVVDPIKWPQWVIDRYKIHNIEYEAKGGEDVNEEGFDEVWIYNCLQHVLDPELIIKNALKAAPVLRIFEWINTHDEGPGHPHILSKDFLDKAIGQEGNTVNLNVHALPFYDDPGIYRPGIFNGEPSLRGEAYYGVFKELKQ